MKGILIFILMISSSYSFAGSVLAFYKCQLQAMNADGKVINDKSLSVYVICGDEMGGKTICHTYKGEFKKHTKKSKPIDSREYLVGTQQDVKAFVDKDSATQMFIYPNQTALSYSKFGYAIKGVLGHKICAGVAMK